MQALFRENPDEVLLLLWTLNGFAFAQFVAYVSWWLPMFSFSEQLVWFVL
jgi:hypothetical protein